VVWTKALRASIRITLESIRLTRLPSLRGDSGCRSQYSNRIYTALSVKPEFVQKADTLGVFGLHPLKIIAEIIQILGYGTAADACDD
jgi:hypothetical protein